MVGKVSEQCGNVVKIVLGMEMNDREMRRHQIGNCVNLRDMSGKRFACRCVCVHIYTSQLLSLQLFHHVCALMPRIVFALFLLS